jgi:uncharacterized protein (TIGR03437 family)
MTRLCRNVVFLLAAASFAAAAPKLRLSATTVGPLTIPVGQNGAAQIIEAGNFGDGTFALTATSSASFATATVGAVRLCTIRPVCNPVTIGLNTSTLARGRYTAIITLSDPNAIDAPQTITVTVQIGTGVPDSIDLYAPAGTQAKTSFTTGNNLAAAATPPPGQTLSVAATGGGSFSFAYSFQVTAASPAGTADGDYRGSFQTSGSTNTADNKVVPVILHVTSQPIADPSPDTLRIRAVQGGAKFDKWIQFANRGKGTLTVSAATVNQPWLTAKVQGTTVILTVDPALMVLGAANTATVTVASNARNGPFVVPVTGELVASAAPVSFYRGVLDNALFAAGDPVAPGGIVAVTGEQFTTGAPGSTPSSTLPLTMGGASVFVNDVQVPLFYVAGTHVVNQGGQITFQMPYNVPTGEARVRVDRDGQRGNTVSVQVAPIVPRLMRLGPDPAFIALGIQDHAIAQLPDGAFPLPNIPGVGRPARAGEAIVFYALGLGQTTPSVVEGKPAPADPLGRVNGFRVFFGAGNLPQSGLAVDPLFVGLTPGFVGLYQVNVVVPQGIPASDAVPVSLQSNDYQSNRVNIAVQ